MSVRKRKKAKPPVGDEPTGWFAYAPGTGARFLGEGSAPAPTHGTTVRLMPEYGVDVPLWGGDWETLALSDSLLADLVKWQAEFDETFSPSSRADRSQWVAIKARWEQDAQSLAARIRREIPPHFELVIDLWPLETGGRRR